MKNIETYRALAITRKKELPVRLGIAVFLAFAAAAITKTQWPFVWLAVVVASQWIDLKVFEPLRREDDAPISRTRRAAFIVTAAMNTTVYSSICALTWFYGGDAGKVFAAITPAGGLLNIALHMHAVRPMLLAAGAPHAAYLVGLPLGQALLDQQALLPFSLVAAAGALYLLHMKVAVTRSAENERDLRAASERAIEAQGKAEAANTALAQSAASAAQERTFFNTILENVPAMLVVKDAVSRQFVLLNAAGEALLQVDRSMVLGRTDHDLFPTDQADGFLAADSAVIESGDPLLVELETVATPSGLVSLRTKKVVVQGDDGPRFLLAISEDITAQQQTAQALACALEKAEAANAAKSTFLATMSHEIRTPLNGVLGMTQAMEGESPSPRQAQQLAVIRQAGEGLLAILNDVLDLSKIEAGKLELENIEFDLALVVCGVHAAFAPQAALKGLTFDLVLEDIDGIYLGDQTRVRQILYNFVSNAIKFTQSGRIVAIARETDAGVELSVSDTGLGMTPDALGRAFETFRQADASTTRRYGGSGLGLAISHQLAELMGGQITVETEAGRGSTFTLHAPIHKVARPTLSEAPCSPLLSRGLRVLAAEDNLTNRLVLEVILAQAAIDLTLVANGAEAVAAWEGGRFDVILMDVQMPVMDGPTAARMIREREAAASRARTPIIALTANVMSHQIAQYATAGMDGHVAKPLSVGNLFEVMNKVVAAQAVSAGRSLQG